jgi:protein-S-isoprenylcysteine O-methyltransferase Ste14
MRTGKFEGHKTRSQPPGKAGSLPPCLTNSTATLDRWRLKAKMVRRGLRFQLGQAFLIFIPAGSYAFWQAWAYLGLNLTLQFALMIYFYLRDPQVLKRRLLTREKNSGQKIIIMLLRAVVFSTLVLSGLDHRCGWTRSHFFPVPAWLTVLALLLIAAGWFLLFRILQANRFAASIIQVEIGQTIAADGPYQFVRHPMYLSMTLHWLAVPLALSSVVALTAGAFIIPVFILRLLDEERILHRDLPGYAEYCRQTRYRLVPGVW